MSKLITPLHSIKKKPVNWLYLLWWWIPIVIAFCIEISLQKFNSYRLLNLAENHFFALVLLSLGFLVKPLRLRKTILALLLSSFVFFVFAETLYFTWFGTNFSASSIFVLFETNVAEASEFIHFYINPFSITYATFTFLYILWCWFIHAKQKLKVKPILNQLSIVFLLAFCLVFLRLTKLIDQNFPYLVVRGIAVYQDEQAKLADLAIDEKYGKFTSVKSNASQPRTFVLVIGESSTKHNFELYGYPRKNNPKLRQRKEQVHVFEDVISTNAFTIAALKTALSLNNFESETESTLIQLFNQADFETHWISNQRPIGPYESIVTKMSRAAQFYTYTNTETAGQKTPLDEVLLPHLKTTLKRKTKDKFIVLHLLGTHLQYKDRYPKAFEVFKDNPPNLNFVHKDAVEKRNQYDNAILYTDYLLDQIIQQVEEQAGESYVVYFSDHGDEVFLDQDFAGHNDDNPTPSMFEVPFLLWMNQDFQNDFDGVIDTKRSYSLIDFIHSLADLSSIEFEEFKPEKSIFSEEFKVEKRKIKHLYFSDFKQNFFRQKP